jgi:acyl-CoA dehydrogenase
MDNRAIAFPLPEDVADVLDGLERFVRSEVITAFDDNVDLLDDVRRRYQPNGAFSAEVVELIRQIRMASAKAGYFTLAVPAEMGGGGLGYVAYLAAWERIYHLCGGARWLAQFAISHWAFGPSAVLERVTDRARDEILPGMMAGETMMCFGMSEPDAGSDAAMIRTRGGA